MRRVASDRLFQELRLELPSAEPSSLPSQPTPESLVLYALGLAKRHDPGNPSGQAQAMEAVGRMHLEGGRTEAGVLALRAATDLLREAQRSDGDPYALYLFAGRAERMLRSFAVAEEARVYNELRADLLK